MTRRHSLHKETTMVKKQIDLRDIVTADNTAPVNPPETIAANLLRTAYMLCEGINEVDAFSGTAADIAQKAIFLHQAADLMEAAAVLLTIEHMPTHCPNCNYRLIDYK